MKKFILSLLLAATLPLVFAEGPAWWNTRGIIDPASDQDDYVALNQGQLKNFAYGAFHELQSKLGSPGPGSDVQAMIDAWLTNQQSADDYAVANVGQLKAVAKPIYQRLLAAGQISQIPAWLDAASEDENYAVANIGQAKAVFNFNVVAAGVPEEDVVDSDGDGISDAIEISIIHTDPNNADSDGDGVNDGIDDAPNDPNHSMAIHVVILTPTSGEVIQ